MPEIIRAATLELLIDASAQRFVDTVVDIQQSGGGVSGDGIARVVVTGGGAGIGLLRRLAELADAAQQQSDSFPMISIDWSKVVVFFGDERAVAVDDPDSNEGQAREALLDHVGVPAEHIISYRLGELSVDDAATSYAEQLHALAPQGFDLHLLGMGGEGHINSLFPHSAAVRETSDAAVAVTDSPKPPASRVTLTLPAVNRSQRVWFLVAGEEKASAAARLVAGDDPDELPAAGAHGTKETLLFLADSAALDID